MPVALSSGNLLVQARTPAAPMIIAPALHALSMLQAVELAWKMALAGIVIWINALAGNIWAWRVVKFVYADTMIGLVLAFDTLNLDGRSLTARTDRPRVPSRRRLPTAINCSR